MSPDAPRYVLLVDCLDEKGIVHKITGILYRQSANVEDQAQFVDKEHNHFFMRTEVAGELDDEAVKREIEALGLTDLQLRLTSKRRKDVVLMAGREAHCLGDLLLRHAYGEIYCRVRAVVANHEDLAGLAAKFEIPFHCLPHEGRSREEHEKELAALVSSYRPSYIVLAKYMRILSAAFVRSYPNRIINIHHSFLPAFCGARPYHQAFSRGVKIIGATAHFVNEDLDQGPIISQGVIPTSHNKRPNDMIRAGRDVEKVVLARALHLVLDDRVFVHANRTVIFD